MLRDKKILIVEDEVLIAEHLKSIIVSFGYLRIEMAHTQKSAMTLISTMKPHIVLLDVRLDTGEEGIALGKKLYEEYKIPFIYVTAFSEKKIIERALTTHPSSFITKPFKPADIFAALNLVYINNPALSKSHIEFKYSSEFVRLATNEIKIIEREGNYIKLHCTSKSYLLRESIEWALDRLPEKNFLRVHRSFVVNLYHIEKRTSDYLYIDKFEIPVSRNIKIILHQKLSEL